LFGSKAVFFEGLKPDLKLGKRSYTIKLNYYKSTLINKLHHKASLSILGFNHACCSKVLGSIF